MNSCVTQLALYSTKVLIVVLAFASGSAEAESGPPSMNDPAKAKSIGSPDPGEKSSSSNEELERARKLVEEADRLKAGTLDPSKVTCDDLNGDLSLICRLKASGKHEEVIDRCSGAERMKFRIHAKHECR